MSFTGKSHKSTKRKYGKFNRGEVLQCDDNICAYSSRPTPIPNPRVIKQKHRRWRQRIKAQVDIARMLDLPMTQALTINWEKICSAKDPCKSMQSGFLRRLQRLSKRLRFEFAYIWVMASGTKVGLHAHMMLYWPQRFISNLLRELRRLTHEPTAIHVQSINLIDRKDYYWGQYLADHIIKHAHYSRNRNFGYSRNLSAAITKIEATI